MDIATVIGLVAGIGLVVTAILLGGSPGVFLDIPSVLIVCGGTIASTLINYPLGDVLSVMSTLRNAFFHKAATPDLLIKKLVGFAVIARREGILALESHARDDDDEFLQMSIQLAIDGTAPELIKDILTTELAFMEDRHALGQSVLTAMGTFAPAFGMIGTLIGLVQMLTSLSDPSQIGGGMAVALLTTLYGALLSNVFFLPAAGKLKVRTSNELLIKEVIIEGILSIQSGDNPRIVEQKLKSFIAPALRAQATTSK
ncbi:MAG: MotA/TolQ/ExbB proton channel family protein [Candidatus Hydrogenedentes bacterium]|nr:MotA/TolQ/ExbB proton channel family protein [Candidatus Hydrogenedentota bacterium]